jgi:hypothetical protein
MCEIDRNDSGGAEAGERFISPLRIGVPQEIPDITNCNQRDNWNKPYEIQTRATAGVENEKD